MKFSLPLSKHNLYRLMRNQWKAHRKRKLVQASSLDVLDKHNMDYVDANEFVSTRRHIDFDFSSIVGLYKEVPKDKNHPLYKEVPCYVYRDHSVLLEGLPQALVLTNTVQLECDVLPQQINDLIDSVQLPNQDEIVERCIMTSCLYDAEQKKLPKRKDPERPAWNFPRDYGITDTRKNRMLCSRLLHLCSLASPSISRSRGVLSDVPMSVPLQWEEDSVQLELRADMFVTSKKPLPALVDVSAGSDIHLPELTVSHPLISLVEENFYELRDVFPLKEDAQFSRVHTIVVHYNNTEVKNIYETPVIETQVFGRSLLKAFTAAMAQARYTYGPSVKELPEPIVVQCVQTDGQNFHFSVLQLNSADILSNQRNVYWSLPSLPLYDNCSYMKAEPTLQGYNPQIFKQLLAFYINS